MTTKPSEVRQLRGKIGSLTKRFEEDRAFFYKQSGEKDAAVHSLTLARNDLAWVVLDCIETLEMYRYDNDPVLKLVRAGLRARLEDAVPGFQAKVDEDRARMREMHASADAAAVR